MIILVILDRMAWQSCQILILSRENYFVRNKYYRLIVSLLQSRWERGHLFKCLFALSNILCKRRNSSLFSSYEFYFPGYRYNLVGYELNRDTNDASTIFICVPIGSVIVDFLGPTNIASRKAMISTIPFLFVRVWKDLTSLSVVLVV